MNVKIIRVADKEFVDAEIIKGKSNKLPTFQDGWRFDFSKHSKSIDTYSYILVCEETNDVAEGCLIYKMKAKIEPYMAFIENAPHNIGENKKYDLIAACLIAFACRLSFIHGIGDYKGWLAFDVQEETKENQKKLMLMYSKKYYARKFSETTMLIMPEDGERLIEKYLEN
jgi:hypothetical protein